jgi:hypothetical protein
MVSHDFERDSSLRLAKPRKEESNKVMSGRPAKIRQRDLKQALLAAQKAGLEQVKVDFGGGVSMTFPLVPDDDKPAEADEQITL